MEFIKWASFSDKLPICIVTQGPKAATVTLCCEHPSTWTLQEQSILKTARISRLISLTQPAYSQKHDWSADSSLTLPGFEKSRSIVLDNNSINFCRKPLDTLCLGRGAFSMSILTARLLPTVYQNTVTSSLFNFLLGGHFSHYDKGVQTILFQNFWEFLLSLEFGPIRWVGCLRKAEFFSTKTITY